MTQTAERPYELAVYIGRFSPPCIHHIDTVVKGLEIADHVLVIIGSANSPRTIKKPFTADERYSMLRAAVEAQVGDWVKRVHFAYQQDHLYNDARWISEIQERVEKVQKLFDLTEKRVALLGCQSDESSWYLNKFPSWEKNFMPIKRSPSGLDMHATAVRDLLFYTGDILEEYLDMPVVDFLEKFRDTEEYETLKKEWDLIQKYREAWSVAPYPPVFVTVDAVVHKAGHILLVKRKDAPGRGLWALPGGFLNPKERIFDACIRELYEETCIDLPKAMVRGSKKDSEVFDHPDRSLRGRTITHAFYFDIVERAATLPKVKGSDDAEVAKWFAIYEIEKMREEMFEDHFDIISYFVN